MDLDYNDLDSGIRETVRWLHGAGFDTHDSGDGISKFDPNGDELPGWEGATSGFGVAHVVMKVEPEELASEADRLFAALKAIGVEVCSMGPELLSIEISASYDPANGFAVVILSGLTDAKLLECQS